MATESHAALDDLVRTVRESRKYRTVDPGFVRDLGARELKVRKNPAEAIKAVKNKLHQVVGAFLEPSPKFERWTERLEGAARDGPAFRAACADLMENHASTRERRPHLEAFYGTLLSDRPSVNSVLDVGAGLHPLALPWMGLPVDAEYIAWDVHGGVVDFLNAFFPLAHPHGRAEVRDALRSEPEELFDVAFLLKCLPGFEQIDKTAPERLLDSIPARCLIVSYPARTLGGGRKGMETGYTHRFEALAKGKPWTVEPFAFPNEQVFRVTKAP